jgi:hypothetical protein
MQQRLVERDTLRAEVTSSTFLVAADLKFIKE